MVTSAILIYGKWKVGQSLARFCQQLELPFTLCDDFDAPESFDSFSAVIPSPGIPSSHRVYESDKILSELDFLSKYIPKWFQIHSVTGTDGKSTTSWLLFHFLQAGFPEIPVYLGGNFWTAFADVLCEILQKWEKEGHVVLEVSSFMAYHIRTFYSHNTILTNLHPDHLDWHRDTTEYFNAKLNLLGHTKNLILYPSTALQVLPDLPHFPIESVVIPPEFSVDHWLLSLTAESMIDISERQLFWDHNIANIYTASVLALRLWVPTKVLSTVLPSIPALPHRLQQVSDTDGKIWVDDSKSTTAQSLYAALRAFAPRKVHLIAWGKNKGDTFDWLTLALREHCAQCVAIGETKSIFLQSCHDAFVPAHSVATMQEAVQYMSENTQEWDLILLSPGCSSLDMFEDYEDRARQFRHAIDASE